MEAVAAAAAEAVAAAVAAAAAEAVAAAVAAAVAEAVIREAFADAGILETAFFTRTRAEEHLSLSAQSGIENIMNRIMNKRLINKIGNITFQNITTFGL